MNNTKGLQKLNYDPIPADLKEQLIKFALEVHEKEIGLSDLAVADYQKNTNEGTGSTTADNSVYVYLLHPTLTNRIQECYSKFFDEYPTLCSRPGRGVMLQVINGHLHGQEFNSVQPHQDPEVRSNTLMYILSPGGDNVKTTWYKIKDETMKKTVRSNPKINDYDYPIFTKDMLEPIEEHIMQEDCWYHFNHSIPHGVENIKSKRIVISCLLDYENSIKKKIGGDPDIVKLRNDWGTLDCMK